MLFRRQVSEWMIGVTFALAVCLLIPHAIADEVAVSEGGDIVLLREDGTWQLIVPSELTVNRALNDREHDLWSHPSVVNRLRDRDPEGLSFGKARDMLRTLRNLGMDKFTTQAEKVNEITGSIIQKDREVAEQGEEREREQAFSHKVEEDSTEDITQDENDSPSLENIYESFLERLYRVEHYLESAYSSYNIQDFEDSEENFESAESLIKIIGRRFDQLEEMTKENPDMGLSTTHIRRNKRELRSALTTLENEIKPLEKIMQKKNDLEHMKNGLRFQKRRKVDTCYFCNGTGWTGSFSEEQCEMCRGTGEGQIGTIQAVIRRTERELREEKMRQRNMPKQVRVRTATGMVRRETSDDSLRRIREIKQRMQKERGDLSE